MTYKWIIKNQQQMLEDGNLFMMVIILFQEIIKTGQVCIQQEMFKV